MNDSWTRIPQPIDSDADRRALCGILTADALEVRVVRVRKTQGATPKRYVDEAMAQGKDVILDIEVQGALQVIGKRPDTVRIFIAPPSWDALEQRLTGRGTDSPEKIQKRLVRAKVELQTADTYDYFVINDTVENAVREINAIMLAEHCRPSERMEILQ